MTYTTKQLELLAKRNKENIENNAESQKDLVLSVDGLITFLALNRDNLAAIAFIGISAEDAAVIATNGGASDGIEIRTAVNDIYARALATRCTAMGLPDGGQPEQNPLAEMMRRLRS